MSDERITEHLDAIDDVIDTAKLFAFPPSFDEWNAIRVVTGRNPGDFIDYLREIGTAADRRMWDTLVYFSAIDDDDYVPDGETL